MRLVRLVRIAGALGALSLFGPGCAADGGSAGGGGRGGGGGDAGPAGPGEASHADCTDGLDNDGDGLGDCDDPGCAAWAECGGGGGGGGGGADAGLTECASLVSEADSTFAPVDILWVVDSSGSMREEADLVRRNIGDFARDISASGIDYRVVMMTDPGFLTVPPPLGTDAERYLFVAQPIGSHDAFAQLLARYDDYGGFLRARAATHIVVVTDDESNMREGDFRTQMEAKLGHSFRFHAVASEEATHCDPVFGWICTPGCAGPHGEAADVGARYYSLARLTGGTTFSICASDWSALFVTLRESVIVSAMLPCYYELPDPPEGEVFDKERVNVDYTAPGARDGTTLPRAIDESRCWDSTGAPVSAWHFDDNEAPTRIILCPAACDLVEAAGEGARVDIALGCETEMILI